MRYEQSTCRDFIIVCEECLAVSCKHHPTPMSASEALVMRFPLSRVILRKDGRVFERVVIMGDGRLLFKGERLP